jgi:hypothetical protein
MTDCETASLVVTFQDITHLHHGILREGPTYDEYPNDINAKGSAAVIETVTSAAAHLGGTMNTSCDCFEHKNRSENNFDGGITSTLTNNFIFLFGSGGAGWLFFKEIKPLLLQWLKNKESRSVTVKRGDISIVIKGENDLEKVTQAIGVLDKQRPKGSSNTKKQSSKKKITSPKRGGGK